MELVQIKTTFFVVLKSLKWSAGLAVDMETGYSYCNFPIFDAKKKTETVVLGTLMYKNGAVAGYIAPLFLHRL